MADNIQNALQLLQGGEQAAPAPTDSVSSALTLLKSPGSQPKPTPFKIGAEGLPDAVQQVAAENNPFANEAIGAKALWDAAALKLKKAAGFQLSPEDENTLKLNEAFYKGAGLPGQAGAAIASLGAMPVGEAALAAPVVSGLAKLPFAGKLITGGVLGGTTAAATSPDNRDLGLSELAGVGGAAAANVLGRIVQPVIQSPFVQKLTSSGVIPTIGQALGGVANSIEQKLTSIPGLGDIIKNAQGRAVKELNRAAIQEAAPNVTAIGREGLRQAESEVGQLYDKALSNITVKADASLVPHLQNFVDSKKYMMSSEQRAAVRNYIDSVVGDNIDQGKITGAVAKKIDSELGSQAASWRGSSSAAEREMGKALQDAQTAFRQQMQRGASTPEAAAQLAEANQRWSKIVRLQRAEASGKEGEFTPGQLQRAVKQEDKSLRKGQFAKGQANMQELSEPAVSVLGDRYPDSGTVGRALMAGLALGGTGGAGANEYLGGPNWITRALTGTALAAIPYSRPGARYLLGDYAAQAPIAAQMRALAPYLSVMGGALASQQ